ncbi:hypothetical protein BpHYR1_036195 [Brachionus plicatilis]|uniref:Uncharacterized protein n=1 Tax=Brachionus plicatilis TaxID=10195 RepID=A0A3M7RJQ8_BRAPC|nr:hypothetical protein BpHYR1_036195 [Brachionus plicatilis]
MLEKMNDLNARLENVSLNIVKRNALAIEKVSYETPKPSNEAVQSVNVLLNKNKSKNKSFKQISIQVVFYVNCVVSWGKRNIV